MPARCNYGTEAEYLAALRDWFAGQALTGIVSCPHEIFISGESNFTTNAYTLADRMMIQRTK
jgi:hypothetical protein